MNDTSALSKKESIADEKTSLNANNTVLLFSPDLDLCTSLTLLLQNRFRIVTTTQFEFVHKIVDTLKPHILIADLTPSEKLVDSISRLKTDVPSLKIILFLDSWINYKKIESSLMKIADAIFYQPIDLIEINKKLDLLIN